MADYLKGLIFQQEIIPDFSNQNLVRYKFFHASLGAVSIFKQIMAFIIIQHSI